MKLNFILFLFAFTLFSCSDDEGNTEKECFRCSYSGNLNPACPVDFRNEACVLMPYNNSLQVVMEINEFCDGQIVRTREEIGFLEVFLEEQINAGASCEEF